MMNETIVKSLAFTIPAMSAAVCLSMLLYDVIRQKKNRQERRLWLYLLCTYAVAALCWTGLTLQTLHPRAFVHYQPLFLCTLMMDQVLIYLFVHLITVTEKRNSRFNRWHFAFPALFTLVAAVSAAVIPFDRRMAVIYGGENGHAWFAALYLTMNIVFIVYNVCYPVLGLLRIQRYRRNIMDFSADVQRISLNWLFVIQMLTLVVIPIPLAGLLLNIDVFNHWLLSLQGVPVTFFVYPILCYNFLAGNYVIVPFDDEKLPDRAVNISPEKFSKYLLDRKPYLNPDLRITDVASDLLSNRNYVSSFINKTYNMSFCQFINCCRLQELERLRLLPQNRNYPGTELVLMAGFSNYRSYRRVKSETDKKNVLKAFERNHAPSSY